MKSQKKKVNATCHPDKPHTALGLCNQCYQRKHREENIQAYRASARRYIYKKYGIEEEFFEDLLKVQDYKCAICPNNLVDVDGYPKYACVDHDHKTGKVRGLLCVACNTGIGHLKDNPTLCVKAANYLLDGELVVFKRF